MLLGASAAPGALLAIETLRHLPMVARANAGACRARSQAHAQLWGCVRV